jgi:hypothetical protein
MSIGPETGFGCPFKTPQPFPACTCMHAAGGGYTVTCKTHVENYDDINQDVGSAVATCDI